MCLGKLPGQSRDFVALVLAPLRVFLFAVSEARIQFLPVGQIKCDCVVNLFETECRERLPGDGLRRKPS